MAWLKEVETNPFPSIMGRICPHPCESSCNRVEKDGAVAINSVERTIGDWGIERSLKLKSIDNGGPYSEKIAVIGSGPSGLSCAYQLARRGYKVTVFESFDKPGGMLRYGIPPYRLPREVLDAEIGRIIDLGVDLKCNTSIGRDIPYEDIKKEYDAKLIAGELRGRYGSKDAGTIIVRNKSDIKTMDDLKGKVYEDNSLGIVLINLATRHFAEK